MDETIINPMDNTELSPADYAALMLACTDENGLLSIPESHFTDGFSDFDESAERIFEMDWDNGRLKELIETFETLYGDIKKNADICISVGCDPLDSAYAEEAEKEAAKYLGDGIFDDAIIWRSRRTCILLALRAPELIINNEAQRLIEAMALTRFARREIRK